MVESKEPRFLHISETRGSLSLLEGCFLPEFEFYEATVTPPEIGANVSQAEGWPESEDYFYLRDIDWSGFGSSWKPYKANTATLRAEVPYISLEEFNERRTAFLKVLVCLPRPLYCTAYYRDRLTEQAENNIQNELRELKLKKDLNK